MSTATEEKFEFKTEIQELLHLIVHTLYSHKEIFLRELLSNSADALSKVQFEALTNDQLYDKDQPLEISILFDKDKRTLTITDTGIGMTKEEVISQIGTIAHSGTKQFLKQMAENKEKAASPELIGQFGVGFYSVFMVADKVTLETRSYKADEEGVRWESDGTGSYTLAPSERRQRGTQIVLHLKEGEGEFLEKHRLEGLIKQYSNYLPFPVNLDGEKANQPEALWRKSKQDIKDEEYQEFYKSLTGDFGESLHIEHFSADAPVQFNALLFVPQHAPFESYQQPAEHGIKLYAKRVFIMDNNKQLIPQFLRFLKGVVESEDIELNVSRESIQNDANIAKINKVLTKKVLDGLTKLAKDDEEKYQTFWKQFGRYIKEGVHSEFNLREKLTPLLRFHSLKCADAPKLTLAQYKASIVEDQKAIYYAVGESLEQLRRSPHLEFFQKNDLDVLLLTEPVDDLVLSNLGEYEKLKFINVESGDLDLPEKLKEEVENVEVPEDMTKLADKVREVLQENINKVRFSKQLSQFPCRFYNEEGGLSHNVRKLMFKVDGMPGIPLKRDLELNPDHTFVKALSKRIDSESIGDQIKLLYHMANLSEGNVDDPQELANLVLPLLR